MLTLAVCLLLTPQEDVADLIDRLASRNLERREAAEEALVVFGRKAVPALEKAASDGDLEVRARAAAALKEILRRERETALRKTLNPELLEEAPDLPRVATGESVAEWMKMLRDLSGWEVRGHLYPSTRAWLSATRRDLLAVMESYAAGPWSNDVVEGALYAVADACGVGLTRDLWERKHSFLMALKSMPGRLRLGRVIG